jgi:acyl-CoA reductase-like NAD-dependent aldehyde dehydrogenase
MAGNSQKPGLNKARVTSSNSRRIPIQKTYKLFIDGEFLRTESGRYYELKDSLGNFVADISRASRKDLRNAVAAARQAFPAWAKRTAANRGQILYRMGEVLEGRRGQFIDEIVIQGEDRKKATTEVDQSIDRLIHYAGWSDKYQQIFSTVNPVASSHFNFSLPQPMGVIAAICEENTSLAGLVSAIAPIIVGGNCVCVVPSQSKPLSAITLCEVLNTSDLPKGVVNILTGLSEELVPHIASHMDINGVCYFKRDGGEIVQLRQGAAQNLKRIRVYDFDSKDSEEAESPYMIMDAQELQTTWHPIGI